MHVSVIVNRSCKMISNRTFGPESLKTAFARVNVAAEIHLVEAAQVEAAADRASVGGEDAVVVAGGDGTIGTAAGILAGRDTPIGVLPCGTFNHFAQDTGIPLDFEDAVRLIGAGVPRRIDLAEVNGRVFVNNSSVGLYPRAVRLRNRYVQRLGGGKQVAMIIALLSVLRRFPLLTVQLERDGRKIIRTTPFVFVGNNEYRMDLFNLGRRTTFTGGRLCLYTADCTRRASMVRIAVLALINQSGQQKDFHTDFVEEVLLQTRRRRLPVSMDGEVLRMEPPLRYRILPRSLRVILPADTAVA